MQIKQSQKKNPDTSKLVKKSNYNATVTELENKTPNISRLVTTSALTADENKIPKTPHYDTKISELEKKLTDHKHDKYITTPEFNKLTAENFAARLAQASLITKRDFDAKLSSLNRKVVLIKQKIYLFKINWKNQKHLIQSIFVVKVISKMMVHKIIQYFRQ